MRRLQSSCRSIKNTTAFINRLIELEQPDLVVHTGDIIDWATHTSQQGMEGVYGISIAHSLPWAASLGNHDGQSNLNRSQVMDFILGMSGTATLPGPTAQLHSYGNYYLNLLPNASAHAPSFRLFFLDSDTNMESINPDQVAWYLSTSRQLQAEAPAPALMFFHIPLEEYETAAKSTNISGGYNEAVSFQPVNSGLFAALVAGGDVVATFCGHDHTNDFCAQYYNINLCYEGSPGYQAYGKVGFTRRARVTEIRDVGRQVRSWKRLDDAQGSVVNNETLWHASQPVSHTERAAVDPAHIARLPRRSQ